LPVSQPWGCADWPALPVLLDAQPNVSFSELAVRPTRAGATSPVTQIADDESASQKRWTDLPPLTIRQAMAGALLLSGVSAASTNALPGNPLYQVKRTNERAQVLHVNGGAYMP
jgi:hypothetical protein